MLYVYYLVHRCPPVWGRITLLFFRIFLFLFFSMLWLQQNWSFLVYQRIWKVRACNGKAISIHFCSLQREGKKKGQVVGRRQWSKPRILQGRNVCSDTKQGLRSSQEFLIYLSDIPQWYLPWDSRQDSHYLLSLYSLANMLLLLAVIEFVMCKLQSFHRKS